MVGILLLEQRQTLAGIIGTVGWRKVRERDEREREKERERGRE